MQIFAPSTLLTSEGALVDDDVHKLCTNYSLDTSVVHKELRESRLVYRQVHNMVNMADLMSEQSNRTRSRDMVSNKARPTSDEQDGHVADPIPNEPREEEEVEGNEKEQSAQVHWTEQSFVKSLRVMIWSWYCWQICFLLTATAETVDAQLPCEIMLHRLRRTFRSASVVDCLLLPMSRSLTCVSLSVNVL